MSDPFKIIEPTVISFSGGRTSAYMLWRVLQSNNGLPDDAIVCFANTGKEEEATLQFVHDCETNWGVPIHWVEYRINKQFEKVDFQTASRNGEPFETIIRERKMLPNPRARFCTAELKIRTMRRYLHSIGWAEHQKMIGIRADEPRRALRMKPDHSSEEPVLPLYLSGVTKSDVLNFWSNQNFDLMLPVIEGETIGGNCDLCFLKAMPKLVTLITQKPERVMWWAKMESLPEIPDNGGGGNVFSINRPRYADIHKFIGQQKNLFDDEQMNCFCGD
jgi:3'-phosphoadenosine 5'-phosphosulfate sulfotransferase (PAPS reductase)/FAD synthetase